eukprot:NODE_51_length_27121_cov_0.309452.p19 type:complete len:110 gc:universal NODE_51_length_27121_cov_0.309452:25398-25069(-)
MLVLATLEFLYGTCPSFFASADITSPNALNDLFILWVSFNRCPSLLLCCNRSLPAKSTRFKLPFISSLLVLFIPFISSVNTECDLLLCSLLFVDPTLLVLLASSINSFT